MLIEKFLNSDTDEKVAIWDLGIDPPVLNRNGLMHK